MVRVVQALSLIHIEMCIRDSYISRPDLVQPLFTQYCDGKRVKRAGWLSQWGSKELADQGLNALQILKTYYGSDIVLKQAKKVEGIPLSFTNVLKIGSTGDAVKTIQQQLNTISNNYPDVYKRQVQRCYLASGNTSPMAPSIPNICLQRCVLRCSGHGHGATGRS